MKIAKIIGCLSILALLGTSVLTRCANGQAKSPAPLPPNGLALTPPMGWNSWNKFACNVSESLIKSSGVLLGRGALRLGDGRNWRRSSSRALAQIPIHRIGVELCDGCAQHSRDNNGDDK